MTVLAPLGVCGIDKPRIAAQRVVLLADVDRELIVYLRRNPSTQTSEGMFVV